MFPDLIVMREKPMTAKEFVAAVAAAKERKRVEGNSRIVSPAI